MTKVILTGGCMNIAAAIALAREGAHYAENIPHPISAKNVRWPSDIQMPNRRAEDWQRPGKRRMPKPK